MIILTLTEGSIWDKLPQTKFVCHKLVIHTIIMHITSGDIKIITQEM